jgi:DNA-binding NtrC family response regulator
MHVNGVSLPGMIGHHRAMIEMYQRARLLAQADVSVGIVGETGTGKELVARAIHGLSRRTRRGFVPINCAAIPDGLAESELFGVEAGAYTGAVARRAGALTRAHRGTLFLDELCGASNSVQAKLLRAVEYHEFTRLGGRRIERSDFRFLASLSDEPQALVAAGRLRSDLQYRLDCLLYLPPLRERPEDIAVLARHFLKLEGNGSVKTLTAGAERALLSYGWPGNVRELRRTIRALAQIVASDAIEAEDVEREVRRALDRRRLCERDQLLRTLYETGWNAARTARILGMGRTKLYELFRRHGVRRPGGSPAA